MCLITWITTHLPTPEDGWLSWSCWLTDSGRLNLNVVTHPASSLAQDRESSPAETSILINYATPLALSVQQLKSGLVQSDLTAQQTQVRDIVDLLRHPASLVTVFVPNNYTCSQVRFGTRGYASILCSQKKCSDSKILLIRR